jgi:hypothetical protein
MTLLVCLHLSPQGPRSVKIPGLPGGFTGNFFSPMGDSVDSRLFMMFSQKPLFLPSHIIMVFPCFCFLGAAAASHSPANTDRPVVSGGKSPCAKPVRRLMYSLVLSLQYMSNVLPLFTYLYSPLASIGVFFP